MTGIGESQEFRRTITEIASYRESAEDGAAGRPMPDEKAYMVEHGPEARRRTSEVIRKASGGRMRPNNEILFLAKQKAEPNHKHVNS
jgi:hypothetical protein